MYIQHIGMSVLHSKDYSSCSLCLSVCVFMCVCACVTVSFLVCYHACGYMFIYKIKIQYYDGINEEVNVLMK